MTTTAWNKVKERILEYLAVLKLKGDMKEPDPLLPRPSGNRKDLSGPQHRQCDRQKICPHQPGWPA